MYEWTVGSLNVDSRRITPKSFQFSPLFWRSPLFRRVFFLLLARRHISFRNKESAVTNVFVSCWKHYFTTHFVKNNNTINPHWKITSKLRPSRYEDHVFTDQLSSYTFFSMTGPPQCKTSFLPTHWWRYYHSFTAPTKQSFPTPSLYTFLTLWSRNFIHVPLHLSFNKVCLGSTPQHTGFETHVTELTSYSLDKVYWTSKKRRSMVCLLGCLDLNRA